MDSVALLALQVAMVAVQGLISWRKGRNGHGEPDAELERTVVANAAAIAANTAGLASASGKVSHLESESVRISARLEEVAKRVHDQGGLVGAAAMVPELMRKVTTIGEKVAHIEGMMLRRRDADVE